MGKNKKRKDRKKVPYKKQYSTEDVYKAIDAVQKGVPLRQASREFNVPRSTLYNKFHHVVPVEVTKGPATYLSYEEEALLLGWILYCCDRGFPVTKTILLDRVQKIVEKLERKTPFKNNRPGRHWWESFCKRHPEISQRVAQNLTASRVSATREDLKNWFNQVQHYLEVNNLLNIDPSRVFNLDESAFFLCPKGDRVLARKGSAAVYKVISGNEKESLTVLFNVSADGTMLPPFILFWHERIPASITSNLPKGWIAGSTERGWMTAESFYMYMTKQFYPWLVKHRIQFPVILFVDGHSSHLTLELAKFCKEKQIELIALYPNATHILQPLDVAVFHPLKHSWKKTVDKCRTDQNQQLKKENFGLVLKIALDSMPNLPDIIKNGFNTCGLLPFNADAVDYDILNKNTKKKTKDVSNSQTQTNSQPNTCQEVSADKHLIFFENQLPPDTFVDFEEAVKNKTFVVSNSNNTGLFQFWLQMKRLAGESISISSDENVNSEKEVTELAVVEDLLENIALGSFNADSQLTVSKENEPTDEEINCIVVELKESDNNLPEGDVYLDVIQDAELEKITFSDKVIEEEGNANAAVQLEAEPSSSTAFQWTCEPVDVHAKAESDNLAFMAADIKDDSAIDLHQEFEMQNETLCEGFVGSSGDFLDEAIDLSEGNIAKEESTRLSEQSSVIVINNDSTNLEISPKVCISKEPESALDVTISKVECQSQVKNDLDEKLTASLNTKSTIVLEESSNAFDENAENTSPNVKKPDDKMTGITDCDADDKKDIKKIFEEVLPFPSTAAKNKKNKKKLISPVLTSEEWQAHQQRLADEKEKKRKEIEERKRAREEKKKKQEEEKIAKRAKLEEKRKLNEEIKKLKEMKKNILSIKKEKDD